MNELVKLLECKDFENLVAVIFHYARIGYKRSRADKKYFQERKRKAKLRKRGK